MCGWAERLPSMRTPGANVRMGHAMSAVVIRAALSSTPVGVGSVRLPEAFLSHGAHLVDGICNPPNRRRYGRCF